MSRSPCAATADRCPPSSRTASALARSTPLSALERSHGQEPSARAGADGDRRGQDLHRLHAELPAARERRLSANFVSGRSRQSRAPDARRISRLSPARHRAFVFRNLQRSEARRGGSRQGRAGRGRDDPARLLGPDRQGTVGGRGGGFARSRRRGPRPNDSSLTILRSRSRVSISSSPTNATARSTALGVRCSNISMPSRSA